MARDSKRSGTERLKYGICLNDECSMCKSKEIQSVPMRKDLICSECGKELRECPPPKKKGGIPVALIIAIIAVAAGAVAFLVLGKNDAKTEQPTVVETAVQQDTIPTDEPIVEEVVDTATSSVTEEVVEEPIEEEVKTAPLTADNATLSLSYGKYSGAIKDGYPHGQGKLTYTKNRVINRHDMKNREAKPGDYVIGEFFNGYVVYGKLYDSNGNLLGSLNFGVSNEDSYESK